MRTSKWSEIKRQKGVPDDYRSPLIDPDPLHVPEDPVPEPEPVVSWAGWIPLLAVLLITVIAVIWRSTRP